PGPQSGPWVGINRRGVKALLGPVTQGALGDARQRCSTARIVHAEVGIETELGSHTVSLKHPSRSSVPATWANVKRGIDGHPLHHQVTDSGCPTVGRAHAGTTGRGFS